MRTRRQGLAAIAAGALLAATLPGAASAHDGVDHDAEAGAEAALDWSNYEKITLTKTTGEPIDMAVMPDGSVLHTARNGDIRHTDPSTGVTRVVNTVDVYANSEDGMQTVTLDPAFAENGWVYLYYAPRVMDAPYPETTPSGSAPNTLPAGADESYWDQWKGYNQLTRVRWDAASGSLDMGTEQVIIKVEVQRGQCCHVAGDVGFDGDGNVYLATGDNTPASTPGSNGYAPNNNAPGFNPGFDSRRGAGSSNDLRGAVLRITVQEDGSYTVPEGNLFAPGTEGTRPEIFVMGLRNPFRMDVDPVTGAVVWGDYGPDAGTADPQRGPKGYVEWQATTVALNGGWPYCHGPNADYNEWDFATATPGPFFDCAAGPQNNSTWNTGLQTLPPATAPQLWYGDAEDEQPWPELTAFGGGGQGPMGGPVYRYDADNPATTKFPAYWDGKAFFSEFSQDYLAAFTIPDFDGPVTHIEHFLPNDALTANVQPITDSPIDIEFGPDGSLYVLDYGNGFFRQNPEAGLYRIDYAAGDKSPQAAIVAEPISASEAPLTVAFDGSGSVDPEGGELTYEWDVDGDGTFDLTGAQVSWTYEELGAYTVRLRVTDPGGKTGLTSTTVTVGNVAPTVVAQAPPNGGFFSWGDAVPYRFTTTDAEDGTETVCSRLSWTLGLGHNNHAHPEVLGSGCSGAWLTPADAPEHGETENLFAVVVATYTDGGNGDIPSAQGQVSLVLNPFVQEAEFADEVVGAEIVADDTAGAFSSVTGLDAGDRLSWDPVNFAGITGAELRASGTGTIQLRWDDPEAEPFATFDVASTGWETVAAQVSALPTGTGVMHVTSTGGVDLDTFTFLGEGIADTQAPAVTAVTTPAADDDGWFSGPVSVQLAATDDGAIASVEYSVDGGSWTNVYSSRRGTTSAFTVQGEGMHEVRYRATDTGGNVSEVSTLSVGIDTVAPELAVSGVSDGDSLGDSQVVDLTVEASDATSGLAQVEITVDGDPVEAGELPLWTLALGERRLVVTATDEAGLVTTWAATITVTTSYEDLAANVARMSASGELGSRERAQLRTALEQAQRHAAAGRDDRATASLERFLDRTDEPLLVRDAQVLIDRLRCESRCLDASQISIQMFSYFGWTREVGVEPVLAELQDIGYQNIEPFAFGPAPWGGYTGDELRVLLDGYGLDAPSSHGSVDAAGFDATLAYTKDLGQHYVGSGGFPAPSIARDGSSSYADVVATAAAMDELGRRSVANGTGKLFGHNHQWEFTTTVTNPDTGETTTAWEALVQHTDPRWVTFQLDVFWATDAGADVVDLLERYGDRVELLHVKDGDLNGEGRGIPGDVGEGDLDWAPILAAAEGHVKLYVLERDGAPADAEFARDSFEFLTTLSY